MTNRTRRAERSPVLGVEVPAVPAIKVPIEAALLKSKMSVPTAGDDKSAQDATSPTAAASGAPQPSSAQPAIVEDVIALAASAQGGENARDTEAAGKPAAATGNVNPSSNSTRSSFPLSASAFGTALASAERVAPSASEETASGAGGAGRDKTSATLPVVSVTTPRMTASQIGASFTASASAALGSDQAEQLPRDLAMQIVQSMRVQLAAGGGTAQIQLEPSHLGEMTISLHVNQTGQVDARLEAANPAVREWLQTNQHALKSALADQQLTLDRLEIAEPPESRDADRREHQQQSPRDDRSQRRATRSGVGQLFEVVA